MVCKRNRCVPTSPVCCSQMKRFFTRRETYAIAICAIGLFAFIVLQGIFCFYAVSARTITVEYLGRGIFAESEKATEYDYYGEGDHRWHIKVPAFNETLEMHTASFEWNPNNHIPFKPGMGRGSVWIGTCKLTPKSPWRYIDVFGFLGPFECSVYGDWRVDSTY